jgi:OFA family oxalate/formate antiporter-like MFS transporter
MSADYFGAKNATSNYAVLYSAKGVASIFGAWVGAKLYEGTGSWTTGFYVSAVMALIAAGIAFGLQQSRQRESALQTRLAPAQ